MFFTSLLGRAALLLLLASCALVVGGCYSLQSPTNGQVVCGADANVRFTGYVPGTGRSVQIQHAIAASGPWATLGSATSGGQGQTFDDVTYYRFDKSFQLSRWSPVAEGGNQQRTFVRARTWVEGAGAQPAHWQYLDSFDVNLPQGSTPIGCMSERMQAGATSLQAHDYCESDESPVVEVLAPATTTCNLCTEVVVNGNVTIDSALSAARYSCTETINGNLTVTSAAPEQLGLPELESVSGHVNMDYAFPFTQYAQTQYRRRLINLPALATIGGDVTLYAKRTDSSNKLSPNGMDAVTEIGGDITITCFDTNPNVFDSLTSHTGNITIQGDLNGGALDVSASGAFQNLTEVTGNVHVHRFFATTGMFMALEQINGNLTVGDLRFYPSQSFTSLENVSGNFHFVAMKQIGNTWVNSVDVGGELGYIGHTTGTTLTIPLPNAQVGALRIEGNTALTTLTGNSFQVGAGSIVITGNPVLSQCQVNSFLAAQQAGGWSGTSSVSGTLPCAR